MQGLWGIKSFMLETQLWGHSSLLLWYSSNWGSPKFGLLFVKKEQLVDSAAPAQPLLAWAEWEKPTWVQVMHRETWPGTINGPASALTPSQGSSAVLHSMQMGLPHSWWGNAWVSLLQNDRQNHSLGNPPLTDPPCLQGTYCVAQGLPTSPGGGCLCCEMNFLTKKQSFLSCNPRLMSQHFTHQLFTTKSKKSNFKIL